MLNFLRRLIRHIFILPIRFYQKVISPHLPGSCIYSPTCSHYSAESFLKHGIFKGFILSITRIFRCIGVLYIGGKDPVPESFSFRYIGSSYRRFIRKKNASAGQIEEEDDNDSANSGDGGAAGE